MSTAAPIWAEVAIAALLIMSGVTVVISAIGYVRIRDFFIRMHPPAVTYTLGVWTVVLASVIHFAVIERRLAFHAWLIIILLFITVPVTSLLLARVVLFRRRREQVPDTPPPLTLPSAPDPS